MSDSQRDLAAAEYAALRSTIRERGSLRLILFVAGLSVWGAAVVATAAVITLPVASLVPLLVLAAGFEAVAALHIGVERIGRYLEARFESPEGPATTGPAWERTSMAWGQRFPGTGTDPLFSVVFLLAAILNYLPVALTGITAELIALAVPHTLVIWRILTVRAWARRQRAEDLERFRELLVHRQ